VVVGAQGRQPASRLLRLTRPAQRHGEVRLPVGVLDELARALEEHEGPLEGPGRARRTNAHPGVSCTVALSEASLIARSARSPARDASSRRSAPSIAAWSNAVTCLASCRRTAPYSATARRASCRRSW